MDGKNDTGFGDVGAGQPLEDGGAKVAGSDDMKMSGDDVAQAMRESVAQPVGDGAGGGAVPFGGGMQPVGADQSGKKGGMGWRVAAICAFVLVLGLGGGLAYAFVMAGDTNNKMDDLQVKYDNQLAELSRFREITGVESANDLLPESEGADDQREDDVARILTAVTDYMSNNNGRPPFTNGPAPGAIGQLGQTANATLSANGEAFLYRYIDEDCSALVLGVTPTGCGDQFMDPDGSIYRFADMPASDAATGEIGFPEFDQSDHTIYVAPGFECGKSEGSVSVGGSARSMALFMVLGDDSVSCIDNQ